MITNLGPSIVQIIQASANAASTYQQQPTVISRQAMIAPQQPPAPSPIVKMKPPLNILPKPPATSTASGAKPAAVRPAQPTTLQTAGAQQIVLPNQTILPGTQAAGALLLNQLPLIVQQNTAQGVQLILRPGTPASTQITGKITAPHNLILQQAPAPQQPAVLIQHAGHRAAPTAIEVSTPYRDDYRV